MIQPESEYRGTEVFLSPLSKIPCARKNFGRYRETDHDSQRSGKMVIPPVTEMW